MDLTKKIGLGALIGLFAIVIFVVLPIFLIYISNVDEDLVFDYLALVFSWPAVALVITLAAIFRFQDSFEVFLKNVGTMKLPGGFEIQSQTPITEPSKGDLRPEANLPEIGEDTLRSQLNRPGDFSADETKRLESQFDNAVQWANHWKYMYLNLFYVPNTKDILQWFLLNLNQTQASYHGTWQFRIPDTSQRNLILSVLFENGMIKEEKGQIAVTEDGIAFLRFINRIPRLEN